MKRRDFLIASAGLTGSWSSLGWAQGSPCPPSPFGVAGENPTTTSCQKDSSSVPAWRQGMAIGEWKLVSNSSLSGVAGVHTVPGNTGRSSVVIAWNGSCVNPDTSTVYLLGCGGHEDYAGNEVYAIDLEDDAPSWVLRRNATQAVRNGDYYSDGRPSSAHTYNSQVYVPEINRAVRFGNGARWEDASDNYNIDGFDPATNDWDPAGTWKAPAMGSRGFQQSWAVCRDPSNGNVYAVILVNGQSSLVRWNPVANETSIVSSTSFYGYEACSAFDSNRNRAIWCRGSSGRLMYTVGTATLSTPNWSGTVPPESAGLIYVAATDKYYFRTRAAGGAVSQVDAGTLSTSAFSTTGGGSIPGRQNGCYNAFNYCPRLGGAYYVPSYTGGVWFLRIH